MYEALNGNYNTGLDTPYFGNVRQAVKGESYDAEAIKSEAASILDYVRDDIKTARLFVTLCRLKITYPTELERETGIDFGEINRVLTNLMNMGLVARIKLDNWTVHPLLIKRMEEFWMNGIRGFSGFSRIRFFIVNTKDMGGFFPFEYFRQLLEIVKDKWGLIP